MLRFPPLLFLLILIILSAGKADAQRGDVRVVARVDSDSITVERFNASYVQHLIQTGQNDTPQRRYAHLNDLIDTHLLAEAARLRGLEDAEYLEYIDLEIRKVVGGRFFEIAFVDSLPDPTEAEVLEAFHRTNEKVRLRQLFFADPKAADAAYARLSEGADFLGLANEVFSTASFDSTAGDLGLAEYWDLDDAVAEAAFGLSVGEYTEPIRSRYGWHILRLEDRIRNPLLTQHQFDLRREDLSNRVRARRFRLEGSRFVRSFMESLEVEVDAETMHALQDLIARELTGVDDSQPPRVALESHEVAAIEEDFSGESVLATYELDGRRESFTAAGYFEWIAHLPYGEVRHRTAASVGRALRNHALAQKGLSLGLGDDPSVRDEVEYRASLYLAEALRKKLREESDVTPTEAELREAYDRLGFRKLEKAEADFWHIQFENPTEAEEARAAIDAALASPSAFPTFERRDEFDLTSLDELGVYIQKAPLDTPVVMGTGDGSWHLVRVDQRSIEYTSFEDVRDDLEAKYRPYVPEVRLLRSLRDDAEIDIDVDLFDEMMLLMPTEQPEPAEAG